MVQTPDEASRAAGGEEGDAAVTILLEAAQAVEAAEGPSAHPAAALTHGDVSQQSASGQPMGTAPPPSGQQPQQALALAEGGAAPMPEALPAAGQQPPPDAAPQTPKQAPSPAAPSATPSSRPSREASRKRKGYDDDLYVSGEEAEDSDDEDDGEPSPRRVKRAPKAPKVATHAKVAAEKVPAPKTMPSPKGAPGVPSPSPAVAAPYSQAAVLQQARSPLAFLSHLPQMVTMSNMMSSMMAPGMHPGLNPAAYPVMMNGFNAMGDFSSMMTDISAMSGAGAPHPNPQAAHPPAGLGPPQGVPLPDPRMPGAPQASAPPPQPQLYNPMDSVLKTMIQQYPHALLTHPHLQQQLMLPVLDGRGELILSAARQPLMVQPTTGVTVPAAEGVVPVALLKRSGLRDPDATDADEETIPAVSPAALAIGGAMWQTDPGLSTTVSELLGAVATDTFPWQEAAELVPKYLAQGAHKWMQLVFADLKRREQSLQASKQRIVDMTNFMNACGWGQQPKHSALATLLREFDASLAAEATALEQHVRVADEAVAAAAQGQGEAGNDGSGQEAAGFSTGPVTEGQSLASAAFLTTAAAAATQQPLAS